MPEHTRATRWTTGSDRSGSIADTAIVADEVLCDFCAREGAGNMVAVVDGKTTLGPWAYMCPRHFERHGVGLGFGVGQRLTHLQPETGGAA